MGNSSITSSMSKCSNYNYSDNYIIFEFNAHTYKTERKIKLIDPNAQNV